MKKLLQGILLLFLAFPAMAQESPDYIKSQINAQIVPNIPGGIRAATLNIILVTMADSYGNLVSQNTWTLRQTFSQLPIFASCSGYVRGNGVSPATCETTILPDVTSFVPRFSTRAAMQATGGPLVAAGATFMDVDELVPGAGCSVRYAINPTAVGTFGEVPVGSQWAIPQYSKVPAKLCEWATGDNVTDDAAAIQASFNFVNDIGGDWVWTEGRTYYANATILMNFTNKINSLRILGYGSTLRPGPAVTTDVFEMYGRGSGLHAKIVEGLTFDLRNNTTLGRSVVHFRGVAYGRSINLSFLIQSASWQPSVAAILYDGEDNSSGAAYASYWGEVSGCIFRPISGAGVVRFPIGVRFIGATNFLNIHHNVFSFVTDAIKGESAGDGYLANAVTIDNNAFENLVTGFHGDMDTTNTGRIWWNGLKITNNRFEAFTNFFVQDLSGTTPTVAAPPFPPQLGPGNSLVGTYTYITAPPSLPLIIQDQSAFGAIPYFSQWGTGSHNFITNNGNFVFSNQSGSSSWSNAHFELGIYHLWQDGLGAFRFKSSAPTSGTDGTLVAGYLTGATSGVFNLTVPAIASGSWRFPNGVTNFETSGGTNHVVKQASLGGALSTGVVAAAEIRDTAPNIQSAATFTVGTTDYWLINTNASTPVWTLPGATCTGRSLVIRNDAAGPVNSASANVIPITGGSATSTVVGAGPGKWVTLVCNASALWQTMQAN